MIKRQLQSRSDTKLSPHSTSSKQPKQITGLVRATVVGVGLGLVVCLIAAILTPLPEDAPETAGLSDQSEVAPGEIVPATPLSAPAPSLRLPTGPATVDVAALQEELRQLAEQLIRDFPSEAASFHFAAQIYFELKQSELAETQWRQCLGFEPKHMGPYIGLATLLMDKGRNEEAIEVLTQAGRLGGNSPEMSQKLGEAFENLGDIDKSKQALEQGVQLFPDESSLWQALGRVQNQAGQAAEAETSLQRAISLGGENEPLLFALNAALMRQGKTQESAKVRESIAKLKRPKQFEQDTFQDRYDTALTHIAADVMISAATLLDAKDKLPAAQTLLLRAVQLEPKNIAAYQALLNVARRQNQLADQRLLIEKLIELEPKNVVNYTNLASVTMQLGESQDAEEALKTAVALDPQGVLAQAASAKLYLSLGKLTLARLMAAQVVERQPSAAAYRLLAATYQAEGLEDAYVAANKKADELEEAARTTTAP